MVELFIETNFSVIQTQSVPICPMSEEFVRQSQLLDQIVLDRTTMDECGRIEVMWCYPKVHRVLGFICKSGSFDRTKKAFNLDQLDKIGENGVLVTSEPVETDRDRVRQLESLIGCEVWTDEGKRVGRINDYVFQLGSGNIRYYLLASSGLQGLTGKLYSLYPSQILGYGRGRVMVSEGIVPGLELYQAGLDQKLEQKFTGLEERLERKLKRVAEGLNEGLNADGLPVGQELKERAQSLFDRARSVTSEVGSRVKERAQEFLDEGGVNDRRGDWRDADRREVGQREVETIDFDFDDWEEPSGTQEPRQPIAQRYSKRSSGFDDKVQYQSPNQSDNQPVNQSDSSRRNQSNDAVDEDFGTIDSMARNMPRPPLNLTTPKTTQESSQTSKSTGFTAIPRPSTSTSTESEERDPWDDDWG